MVIGDETTPVSEIEFSEDSKDGTENLAKISDAKVGVLDNTKFKIQDDKKLILTGELKPKTTLTQGQNFNMDFYDTSYNELKTVSCTVQNLDSNSGACTLVCDTDDTPLRTNYGNLTLSKSTDEKILYFSINIPSDINDAQRVEEINTNPSSHNAFYRKSSSGLSGGAIAGIVIACVVVLAAASIAAIMLRKPTPPIDNTTVVGLKTVENI